MRNHCQNKHMNFDISKLVQCILATQVQLGNKGIELVQSPAKKQWMDGHRPAHTRFTHTFINSHVFICVPTVSRSSYHVVTIAEVNTYYSGRNL